MEAFCFLQSWHMLAWAGAMPTTGSGSHWATNSQLAKSTASKQPRLSRGAIAAFVECLRIYAAAWRVPFAVPVRKIIPFKFAILKPVPVPNTMVTRQRGRLKGGAQTLVSLTNAVVSPQSSTIGTSRSRSR